MANVDELKEVRLKKLMALENAGISAYPNKTKRTHTCQQALDDFTEIVKSEKEIILVGRIKSLREHGGLCFADIEDGTGKIQVFLRKDRLGEKLYAFFLESFDIGDFIEIKGTLFITKRGEKTIEAADFKMLAKSLLPLPEKWRGLQDAEERYRKRYLDIIFNKEVKEKFELHAKIIREMRNFLEKQGFLEVETPVLQPIYGGASAKPFKTRHNALGMDFYLRISPELYLKRLLVAGFEKIYELGKCFRNEGMDRSHNPDFTMLEFYWAYSDCKDLMKFTEEFLSAAVKKVFGKLEIEYESEKINFKTPWERIEYKDIFRKEFGIDYETVNRDSLAKEAEKHNIEIKKAMTKAEIADEMFKICRTRIKGPAFIINYPKGFFPLCKASEKNPEILESFQLIIAGFEIVKAFSELNNPIEQRKRFEEQENLFKEGMEEAQRIDEDFLEAMEHGMPPASGWGIGVDRFVSILTNSHSLKEAILFPTMRPKS